MTERDTVERRLRTIERAIADGDERLDGLGDAAALAGRVEDAEARLDDAEERIAELEAATQALRGYVGNVRSVNDSVEQRADAALAAVDRLQSEVADGSGDDAARRADDAAGDRSAPAPSPDTASAAGAAEPRERDGTQRDRTHGDAGLSAHAARDPTAQRGRESEAAAESVGDTASEQATARANDGRCPRCAATLASDGGREGEPRTPTAEPEDKGLLARLRDAL